MFIGNGISVLLDETLDIVSDIVSVMGDREGVLVESRLFEDLLLFGLDEILVKLVGERGISTSR